MIWTREQIMECEARHTSGLYNKRPLVLTRGEGVRVWDADGTEYIDCDTGHGVAVLGHCHPRVVEAVSSQAATLLTAHESFYTESRARLLDALAKALPQGLSRVFLCNSGTESIEGALKLARLATGRRKVVAAKRGFHGRTLGALSATWNPNYRKPFEPLVPDFVHITYNDCEEATQHIDERTAAVLVEPVQGESGVFVAETGFIQHLRKLCDQTGAVLIFDEVQTGIGRTGAFTAAEMFGVTPDILCLAKGLAGGIPIGAVTFGSRIGELPRGAHASTFGGNPVACRAAAAVVETVTKENLPQNAGRTGQYAFSRLAQIAAGNRVVREVRGMGLMIGIDLRVRSAKYLAALQSMGVLALDAGPTVIRLLPPITITREEMRIVLDAVEKTLNEVAG